MPIVLAYAAPPAAVAPAAAPMGPITDPQWVNVCANPAELQTYPLEHPEPAPPAPAPAPAPRLTDPDWARKPSAEAILRAYPAKAKAERQDGTAIINCTVEETGRLWTCTVTDERPAGAGFGYAALRLAKYFEVRPLALDGRPTAHRPINIPIRFTLPATQ